jgi:uncharacterized protein YjbI with pentapeptide repeats
MANEDHVARLKRSVPEWNEWRVGVVMPDLTGADLTGCDFARANLSHAQLTDAHLERACLDDADLYGARLYGTRLEFASMKNSQMQYAEFMGATLQSAVLSGADARNATFYKANIKEANLTGARCVDAEFAEADLTRAVLEGADLERANFNRASLVGARLAGANLTTATLVGTDLRDADLQGCRTYGLSAWDVRLEGAQQRGLIITPSDTAAITLDWLEVAQFVYLILYNATLRDVIDSVRSKAVLILGRFTPERKLVLDAMRDALRARNYVPIVFDFDRPTRLNLTETVSTLARLSRFVIADITDARSIPQELQAIVPDLPSVPVQPLLMASSPEYGMFDDFRAYPWVLDLVTYRRPEDLIAGFEPLVISPAEAKAEQQASGRRVRVAPPAR